MAMILLPLPRFVGQSPLFRAAEAGVDEGFAEIELSSVS
jgi:hypothetical protein